MGVLVQILEHGHRDRMRQCTVLLLEDLECRCDQVLQWFLWTNKDKSGLSLAEKVCYGARRIASGYWE